MASSDRKYIRTVIKYCKDLADPPDSFSHREKNHHVVSLKVGGEPLTWTLPKTPSDHRARKQISAMIRRDLRRLNVIPNRALLGFLTEKIIAQNELVDGLLAFLDREALED